MPRLAWDAVGERFYETGIDRGVLYVGSAVGVPWNGLVSIQENITGGELESFYLDGLMYENAELTEEYGFTLTAFSQPHSFGPCIGLAQDPNGLSFGQQRRVPFGLTFRTRIGNDVDGTEKGYKIHIVYDVKVATHGRLYTSLGDTPTAQTVSYACRTKPRPVAGRKATAHIIIDSTKMTSARLTSIENRLYGSSSLNASLPSPQTLIDLASA